MLENQPAWRPHRRSKAALGGSPDRLLKDLEWLGLLFESLVIRDLRVLVQALDGEVFHYRDNYGVEVDAIVQLRDGRWGAIEVKLGLDQASNDFTGFAAFEDNALARIESDALRQKGRVPTNASVFLTIFKTFMCGPPVEGKPQDPEPVGPRQALPPTEPPEPKDPDGEDDSSGQPRRPKARFKLGDGKERSIQHMMVTSFWHPDGTPMSSQQFLELLYGRLPEFVQDEAELRQLWSSPDTRRKLLQGLEEKGFGAVQLAEMQKVINAENSDLFDVLAHVAYALQPIPREERAEQARLYIHARYTSKQQIFLDFVLQHYVTMGVQELAQDKLTPLLQLRYQNSIADAVDDLGRPRNP